MISDVCALASTDLEAYEHRLRNLGLEIADRLRPGLAAAEIDRRLQRVGIRVTDEVRIWFAWQDGFEHPEWDLEIAPGFVLFSLDQAIDWYQQLQADIADIWPASWFPIVRAYGTVLCDCTVPASAPTPIHVIDQGSDLQPYARSLGELVEMWNRSWDIGAWTADGPLRIVRHFEQPEPSGRRNLLLDV